MFDRSFDGYRWWWCVLSGLLLVASFAPFSCATCGWIALVPAWWVLTQSEQVRKRPFRHGYLVGLIYFGGVFWWISNVTSIGTFFLVLYLALYPACWFLFVARMLVPRRGDHPVSILIQALGGAAFWVLLEWWRSWFLTGFNWNELGISQAPSIIFRQLAAYGGVYLISFVLLTVNILWAEGVAGIVRTLLEKRVVRASFPFATALLIVAGCFALGWHHLQRHGGETSGESLRFSCVQPNIPQIPYDGVSPDKFHEKESEALVTTEKWTVQALAAPDKPDLLIWPEATTGKGVFEDRTMNESVQGVCRAFDGYFLFGSEDFNIRDHKLYNCAFLFSPGGDEYKIYRKTRLVILGEFFPFGDSLPWLRKAIGIGMNFTPGPGPEKFVLKKPEVTFSPFICFEDTLPEVAQKAAKLNPDFFVTITNDGWYQGWWAAWGVRQHLNHAIFRSIEHDRSMIRCANTGISCVIDPNGTVTERYRDASGAEIDAGGVFAGQLVLLPVHPTVYEGWGDWIILISALISGMLVIRLFCQPRVK